MIFLCDNILLSLRPAQNEVHPSNGRTHAAGHTGAWAWTEESNHPHILWYDAVWAQLQPRTNIWNGKTLSQNFSAFLFSVWIWQKPLLAKYDICDVYDGVFLIPFLSLQFENELITKLDQEVEGGQGDEQYKVLLEKT